MTGQRSVRWSVAAIGMSAVLLPASAQAQPAKPLARLDPRGETVSYTMRKGDSLYALSERYFLRRDDYRPVQRLNRIANPRRIPVGKVIAIPVGLLRGEALRARLIAARGTVTVRRAGQDLPVTPGMALEIGTSLETGTNGLLTIELPNGSRTTLPTRSRLLIRQLRRFELGGAIDYDLEVGAGKAETEATPTGGKGNFRVRTPRAVSAVRGTRFRVGYDAAERSSAEVLEGVVAVAAGKAPGSDVTQGFGAWITNSGQIVGETLLAPVELADPGKVQIEPLVDLQFAVAPGVSAYHVQIGKDAGFVDIVADQLVDQPVASFADIPNGNWFVRATGLAETGMEGLYQTYAMKRRLTGLSASAEGDFSAMRFRWSGAGEGLRVYRFQMTREDKAALPVIDEGGLGAEGLELRNLEPGTYHWRVGVRQFADGEMTEKWLPFEKLIIAPQGR
jgi:hypothetical protein